MTKPLHHRFDKRQNKAVQTTQTLRRSTYPAINEYNYLDYAEAIHCFCMLNDGQDCELYSILSRSEFKPGRMWTEARCLKSNEVYSEITKDNVSDLFEELTKFLEER